MTQFSAIEKVVVRPPSGAGPALHQHRLLCDALEKSGASVVALAADPLFPDGCYIGDTAVITPHLAVIGNFDPADPRQGEQRAAATALATSRFLKFITAPGLLDARDVLRADDHFFIGLSPETNQEGAAQLAYFLKEFGYEVTIVDLGPDIALRLGQSAAALSPTRLLLHEELAKHYAFLTYDKVVVPAAEAGAANACVVNGTVLMPEGYPRTRAELRMLGLPLVELNISAFEKSGRGLSSLALCMPAAEKDEAARRKTGTT